MAEEAQGVADFMDIEALVGVTRVDQNVPAPYAVVGVGHVALTIPRLRRPLFGRRDALCRPRGTAASRHLLWEGADISSFAGQTIRIPGQATDAATDSLIEAAVDDVWIDRP